MDVLLVRIRIPSLEKRELFEALALKLGVRPDMLRPMPEDATVFQGEIDDRMAQGLLDGGYPAELVEVISRSGDPRASVAKQNPYLERLETHYANRGRLDQLRGKGAQRGR